MRANLISKLARSNLVNLLLGVWIEILKKTSIERGPIIVFIDIENNWRTIIENYRLAWKLLLDKNEAIYLTRHVIKYRMIDEILYKRSI